MHEHQKQSQSQLPSENARRWVASIVLTAIFCALEVNRSLRVGALALPTQYDDISYYLTGAEYLQIFHKGDIFDIFKAYLANPPHAPLSTGLAFLGFLILGVESWAGPVANAALFLFFVRWFFSYTDGIHFGQSVLLAIAFLGFPFVAVTILGFRPDMFCSLLLACGTLYIVTRPHWLTDGRDQVLAGIILAASLWSKPSVFPLSIALFGSAAFLSSLRTLLRGNFRMPMRAAFVMFRTGLLLSLPYYAFALWRTIDYIWTTAFGAEASIWVQSIPLRDHLLFYLSGYYGRVSLGDWLYASPIVGFCTVVVLWRVHRQLMWRSFLVLALIGITYLAVTIPSFKGPHGFPFAATLFVSTVIASVTLVRLVPNLARWTICMMLLAFSAWQFTWPTEATQPRYVETRWSMVRQAFDAMGHEVTGKTFLLTTPAVYINYSILAFEYYRSGLVPPSSDSTQLVSDLGEQHRRIDSADIVFALTPDFTEVFPYLPTASKEMRAQIIKLIEESGRFKLLSRISDSWSGGAALIYVRSQQGFSDFSKIEGLRPAEGPYTQWNLPRVRWGFGAQTKLFADGPPGAHFRLLLDARTVGLPNQNLTVSVNGTISSQIVLSDSFIPVEAHVDFDQRGHAEIALDYSLPSDNAVLYKTIVLEPLPTVP